MSVTEQSAEHQLAIVPAKTDKQLADDLRGKIVPLLQQVAAHMDEARLHGMKVDFGINPDGFGRFQVQPFSISKAL